MSNELMVIENEIRRDSNLALISASLGKPVDDPEILRFISGALMVIYDKPELRACSPASIAKCLIHAANIRLPVDNRNLAYLVPFAKECSLMPSYKGYIYKVKNADPSTEFTVALVYMGDTFTVSKENGQAVYRHDVKNPFEDRVEAIVGAYCYIRTSTGSFIDVLSRTEIEKIRSMSKMRSGQTWTMWAAEMIKKAVIRRACKVRYIEAVAELDALDNQVFSPRRVDTSHISAAIMGKTPPHTTPAPKTEKLTDEEIKKLTDKAKKSLAEKPETETPPAPAAEQKSEPKKETPPAPAPMPPAAEKQEPKEPAAYKVSGLIAKYEPAKGRGPVRVYVAGEYYKTFDKELAETLNRHFKSEDTVELTYHVEKSMDPQYPDSNMIDDLAVVYG